MVSEINVSKYFHLCSTENIFFQLCNLFIQTEILFGIFYEIFTIKNGVTTLNDVKVLVGNDF